MQIQVLLLSSQHRAGRLRLRSQELYPKIPSGSHAPAELGCSAIAVEMRSIEVRHAVKGGVCASTGALIQGPSPQPPWHELWRALLGKASDVGMKRGTTDGPLCAMLRAEAQPWLLITRSRSAPWELSQAVPNPIFSVRT